MANYNATIVFTSGHSETVEISAFTKRSLTQAWQTYLGDASAQQIIGAPTNDRGDISLDPRTIAGFVFRRA